jgi:hypothetical protein
MKKVIEFVKTAFTVSKNWIISNGVEGVAGLLAGLLFWAFGYKIYAGFAFGVFATKNWDIFKTWVLSKLKK